MIVLRLEKPGRLGVLVDRITRENSRYKKYGFDVSEYDVDLALNISTYKAWQYVYYNAKAHSCLGYNSVFYFKDHEVWANGKYMESFDSFRKNFGIGLPVGEVLGAEETKDVPNSYVGGGVRKGPVVGSSLDNGHSYKI